MENKRLAIVDDETVFCETVSEVAIEFGFLVSEFNSAKSFIESIEQFFYDALILDIFMPDMDGIEVIKEISARYERLDIVLCSGYSEDYLKMAAELSSVGGLNVVTTLQKPVRISILEETLQELWSVPSGAIHHGNNP